MEINNTNTLQNLNYDIELKNKKEENSKPQLESKQLSKEFILDIKNSISFQSTSISLSANQIDNRLDALNEIKNSFVNNDINKMSAFGKTASISIEVNKPLSDIDIDKFIESIPLSTKQEELDKAKDFLNPNQKFYTQADKDSFLSRMHDANINLSLLSKEDRQVYLNNSSKAISAEFDKRNDFDSSINSVYFAKKELEASSSLTNKKSVDSQIKTLDKITEKLLEASKDSTSLNKKEALVNEIKDLLKKVDNDELKTKLTKELDNALEKNQEELDSLSMEDLKISSFNDAKKYLELMQKHDASFDDLSYEEKKKYLENKQKVVDTLKSKESLETLARDSQDSSKIETLSQLNTHLNNTLERIQKTEKDEIEELTNPSTIISTTSDAAQFLEKVQRRESTMNNLSDFEQMVFEMNVKEAEQILEQQGENKLQNEINTFLQNVDNVIEILNNAKTNMENGKNIDDLIDTTSFNKENFSNINGSFIKSQSSNIDSNTVYRLTS